MKHTTFMNKIKLLLAIGIALFALTAKGQDIVSRPTRFNNWVAFSVQHPGTTANRILGVSAAGPGVNGSFMNYITVGSGLSLSSGTLTATASDTNYSVVLGEYFTTTDSTFTIPNNVGAVISRKSATQWVNGTITMPAAPINGQVVSIYGNYAAVTVSANSGQTLVGAPTAASVRGAVRFRWRSADSTWYPY